MKEPVSEWLIGWLCLCLRLCLWLADWRLSLSACVCVCVWNIWTDVRLLFLRILPSHYSTNHGGQEPMIVCPGQRRPDNMGVKTYLQFSIFRHGTWLTQEPPCRLQQIAFSCFFNQLIFNQWAALQSFLVGALQSNIQNSLLQSCPFFNQVTCFDLHARCIPLQQFEMLFWAEVLPMSVRQDDMSPSGNTFLGSNLDVRLDLWNHTF